MVKTILTLTDNMRNVVAKFAGRGGKVINEGLLSLAAYYGFRVVTTNVRAGNEKGSVENAVKVVRNAAFAAEWEFDALADAQSRLDAALARLNEGKPVNAERAALSPRRPPYEMYADRPREFAAIMLACGDATLEECVASLRSRKAPAPAAGPGRADPIAEQAMAQIKPIGAIGRSVA